MRSETKMKLFSLLMGIMVAFSMIYTAEKIGLVYTMGKATLSEKKKIVVVDAGHGGFDPGKVGINGAQEKDINLAIAKKLKKYLENGDVEVILTREDENGLYEESDSNKKVRDMKKRVEIMEGAGADLVVSIHQNSYPQEYVHGAQVFYHEASLAGAELAAYIQEQLVCLVDPANQRQIKANDSYYLLKKTSMPIVIVECGFLSNYEEAEKLVSEEYQDRIAWAVYLGIVRYMSQIDR